MDENVVFPWYDGQWLRKYEITKDYLKTKKPELLDDFMNVTNKLKTKEDFKVINLSKLFNLETIEQIKKRITELKPKMFNTKPFEISNFGRFVVHNDPFFNDLQENLISLVSAQVNEEVEISYNFLSVYTNLGDCPVHLDAPEAKWTLDVCIDQSKEWPIHISQVRPWPNSQDYTGENWRNQILEDPKNDFSSYIMKPGDGIIFSGSSQYHFREKINDGRNNDFCHLLFFHFIPKGTKKLIQLESWPDLFGTKI